MPDDIPVWSVPVDWKDEVAETLEFMTDVIVSQTGEEQRRAVRLSPRRFFDAPFVLIGKNRVLFDLAVTAKGGSEWFIPLWPNVTKITADVAAGDTIIPCSTLGREFLPGGYAIIRKTPLDYALVQIATVNSGNIVANAPLAAAWKKGVQVFPARKARFVEQPQASRHTGSAAQSRINFRITTENDLPENFYALALTQYLGYPVLTMRPDSREQLEYAWSRYMAEFDSESGKINVVDTANNSFPSQTFRWFLKGVEEKMRFRALMYSLMGRQKAMWMPTFNDDLELTANIANGDTSIQIAKCGYTLFGGPNSGRRYVRIELKNGTNLFRRITGSGIENVNFERLPLSDPFTSAINKTDVRQISFMSLVRLEQDVINISHKTDIEGIATSAVVFRALMPGFFFAGWNRLFNRSFGGVSPSPF